MAGKRNIAAKQGGVTAPGSSRLPPKSKEGKGKAGKPIQKVVNEKSETDSDSESNSSCAGEKVEGWWKAGKKGKKTTKVSFVCRGGDVECGKTITSKEDSIQCEACAEWYHPECRGLCKGAFDAVAEYDLLWICMNCRERLTDTLNLGERLENRVAEAEKRIIKKVVENKVQAAVEIEEKLEAGIKSMESEVAKQMSETSVSLKEVMKNQDQENKVDRTCNVIIHNLSESEDGEPGIRKDHDVTKVQEIAKALGVESTKCSVQNAFRLGQKTVYNPDSENRDVTRKPRLLLVKLESKEQVGELFKERFSLKDKGFPNIYITKDLPLEEREKQRKLRAELKLKGKDTHKIVRGKVVPKNGNPQ